MNPSSTHFLSKTNWKEGSFYFDFNLNLCLNWFFRSLFNSSKLQVSLPWNNNIFIWQLVMLKQGRLGPSYHLFCLALPNMNTWAKGFVFGNVYCWKFGICRSKGCKITGNQTMRVIPPRYHSNSGQVVRLGPGRMADFFSRPQTLKSGNIEALWPTDPKFSALKDLNLFEI